MMRIFLVMCLLLVSVTSTNAKNFTVVIDPGHGGSDPGAVRKGVRESDINLTLALLVGEMLTKNHSDINIVYTRKTDIKLSEEERMSRANKDGGDIFVSIHVNSAYDDKSQRDVTTAHGVEVYIQTVKNSDKKTQTLKKKGTIISIDENSEAIESKYDASSAQYDAIYQIKQAQILNLSNYLATYIRNAMGSESRNIRGVKQKSLYVTWQTIMPSVLVEVGYITNDEERQYMTSKSGQQQLAKGIYNGIIAYKNDFDMSRTTEITGQPTKTYKQDSLPIAVADKTNNITNNQIVFKWQILTSTVQLKDDDLRLKKFKCTFYKQDKLYKYTYGQSTDFKSIDNMKNDVQKFFPDAFIIAMKNGERMDVNEARKQTNQ